MKSPCLARTDSQQENGLILGSMGGNTPTPHKFCGNGNNLISEFDPISANKVEARLIDNYMLVTQPIETAKSVKTFVSPKNQAQK